MNRSVVAVTVMLAAAGLWVDGVTLARPPIREAPTVLDGNDLGIGRQLPDLEYTGLHGEQGRLSELNPDRPVVILLTGTGCPLCRRYAPSLAAIEKEFQQRGVAFLYVNPNRAEKPDRIEKAIATQGFQGPYTRDAGHHIIRALAATTTTEAFVLNGSLQLVYRGAVDDQYGFGYTRVEPRHNYLKDALNAVLRGQSPAVPATSAPGCELWIDDQEPSKDGSDSKE